MKKLLFSILGIIPLVGIFTINAAQYSAEMVEAYEWAYENGIIGESTIDNANLYDALPNPVMRAILLNFASYLGLDSDSVAESFGDLFIDEGSYTNRANFGTALSKILWGDNYEGGNPYYKNHLEALKAAGIITQIENPEDITEIKGYVLIMLMRIAEEYNKIDCNDPVVVLACSDRKSDTYKECPEICRPNGILTNNLTKTVEYKSNEISTKVVFNGTYTALKDGTIKRFTLKHDNIDQSNCQKNISFNDIIFKLYVNGEVVGTTLNPNDNGMVLNSCQYFGGLNLNKAINIKEGDSIQIKLEGKLDNETFGAESKEYSYYIKLSFYDTDEEDAIGVSEYLAPIKIVDTNTKCEGMDSAKVSHTIDNDTITLKWNAIEGDTVEILIYDPQKEVYKTLGTVQMSNRTFTYKVKRAGEQNFLLSNGCNEYNYKVNIKTIEEQEDTSDFGTISITNPNNPSEIITIMDRNLGATSNDITNPKSYGYHFQRGNNYGFSQSETIKTTTNKAIWNNKYNNKGYYSEKFIIGDSYRDDEIISSGDTITYNYHDGIWGGINDSNKNNRGAYANNHKDRQGPCPEGYHVPSAGEWGLLVKYYRDTYAKDIKLYEGDSSIASIGGDGLYYFSDSDTRLKFQKYFKLPLAGFRSFEDGNLYGLDNYGNYRSSSSLNGGNNTISFTIRNSDVGKDNGYWARELGASIRCFKNVNESMTEKNVNESTTEKNLTEKNTKNDNQTNITASIEANQSNGNNSDILSNGYTKEMNDAYEYAHNNGITTTSSIEKAKMNSPLTRIAMAKMLSYYAINVLGQKPNSLKGTIKFNDVTDKQNSEYNNAVTLSYQLGIMGQNMKNNNFRPNDEVTRAEFATALSRMLYGTQDGSPYYTTHLNKLKQEGIITNDNPKLKEKRGYVMLMLMRTAE